MATKNVRLEFGAWNKKPHYAVIGQPVDFYVYSSERSYGEYWSGWVKGNDAQKYWAKFIKLKKENDKDGFISLINELFNIYEHK